MCVSSSAETHVVNPSELELLYICELTHSGMVLVSDVGRGGEDTDLSTPPAHASHDGIVFRRFIEGEMAVGIPDVRPRVPFFFKNLI